MATVTNRSNGTNCPYCSGKRAILGETDLATKNPELAKEWHSTKNENLLPSQVTTCSNKKVWWECFKGHEWMAAVSDRSTGANCPYCSGKKVIPGETDLVTKNPELTRQWHPTKNKKLLPSQVAAVSGKKVWWECANGHEWLATVAHRSNGTNCPYCSGIRFTPGERDLATKNPVLAKEWHSTKNGDLLPSQVAVFSHKKVWWECANGHEWMANISNRSRGSGCPLCSGLIAFPGETDLASKNPVLVKEWHPTRNGDLLPSQVTVCSNKKVWWECSKGHKWMTTVANRSNGSNCPLCAGKANRRQGRIS